MLGIGSAVVKGGAGIMGAIGGHNSAMDQARAQNQAMMDQYKYRLQIRDKQWKDELTVYSNKVAQYDRQMSAADRAASRAYGIEQYNQSQRLKQAAFQGSRLDRALAKSGGAAAASGKSGRSAQRLDTDIENTFVRNQNMIAQNLLTAQETRQYRELGIADRLTSQRNRAYSNVAIAPQTPMELLEPTQLTGPSTAGRNLGILNAGIGMASGIAGAFAPASGDIGGGGGTPFSMSGGNSFNPYSPTGPLNIPTGY